MTKLEYEARVEFLSRYVSERHKLRSADLRLEELELDYGPGARPMGGTSGGKKSDGSDRILRRMADRERFEREARRHRDDALRAMAVIETAISGVAAKQQSVLRYRYLNDMDIGAIAEATNYSYRQVQRIHQQGIERVRLPRYTLDKIKRELAQENPEWALIEMKAL